MTEIVNKVKNELTLEKVLTLALRTPGAKIDRSKFLKKELIKYYPESTVKKAIRTNPAKAGVSRKHVNQISSAVINYETAKVTGLSVAASLPGGVAALGAAAADITSYFVFILRVVQELAYLYGFEEFDLNENSIDSETLNEIMVFLGVMFGVQEAAIGLRKIADLIAKSITKKLANKSLTKGAIYPIVKKIAINVGIHMNKQIFADTVASTVPVVGGILSGGLTYVMFKPCCQRLKRNLMKYNLSDPDYYKSIKDDNS